MEKPLQLYYHTFSSISIKVTILVLVEKPLQFLNLESLYSIKGVTILVLVEKPLQLYRSTVTRSSTISHNPCFSGKTFAIQGLQHKSTDLCCHNPCFSGKTFAMI